MREVNLVGLGAFLPARMVKNAELPALDPPQSLAELDRLGVHCRGWASDAEGVVEMATSAASDALGEAGVEADSLDFLLLANWTERRYVPDVAPRIQRALGASRAFALDICCACSGFVHGLSMAHGYLQNPRFRRGLVVASDRSSRHMRPASRATLIFGDAAAAMVLEREAGRGGRLIDYELRTDGTHNAIMDIDSDGFLRPHIKQRELNLLAGRSIAEVCRTLLARNGLTVDSLDWIIPHSGTAGVQAMIAEHLPAPPSKVLTNLPSIGNVAAASIPAALSHFKRLGVVKPGQLVLSASVGLGWQSAGVLYTA
jgi:3-oxoacyl-[acyl-carrier-protein] synthase III